MTINITTPAQAQVINLSEARNNLVGSAKKAGQVINFYAQGICQAFNLTDNQGDITTPWWERKGKLKAPINDERALFVAAMTDAGFGKPTIDVYWQRVKEASGYVTAGNRVKGKEDTDSKTMTELATIINRIHKAGETGEECIANNFVDQLTEIFEELGGDAEKLGTRTKK